MNFTYVLLLSAAASWTTYEASLLLAKYYVDRRTRQLASMGIVPRGSKIIEGMVVDPENPKRLVRVSAPSKSWYDVL